MLESSFIHVFKFIYIYMYIYMYMLHIIIYACYFWIFAIPSVLQWQVQAPMLVAPSHLLSLRVFHP